MTRRLLVGAAVSLLVGGLAAAAAQLPSVAAGALLHPARRAGGVPAPAGCAHVTFAGDGVSLQGWRCGAAGARRGSLVILHGVADSRASVSGLVTRFTGRGLDVVAYDSRAHGESGGDVCTYGYFEKQDLRLVVGGLPPGPVVLMGTSLGGAVALQAAAGSPRVSGVVAAETFADLRTIVRHRTPRVVPDWFLGLAFDRVEARARFPVDEVSPLRAARSIAVPVLLIHGARDSATPPGHSQRLLEALAGPKRLVLVDGAGHNESLREAGVWGEIDRWMDEVLRAASQ